MAKRKSFSINQSLSKSLEETINAAHDFSGELLVDVVPIERLELDPENPRELHLTFDDVLPGLNGIGKLVGDPGEVALKQKELDGLLSLAKSIESQGLINPIVVYKHGHHYRLVAGERRTLASILVGKKSMQARILPERPNTLKRFILQWAENIEREDLTLSERVSNIRSIAEAYAKENEKNVARITANDISNLVGISSSQAAQYKLVLHASEELASEIKANRILNLDKAAFIAKAPPHEQSDLISLCVQGATLKELKSALSSLSVHKSPAPKVASNDDFRLAIKSEKIAKILFESVLEHEKFIHLRSEFDYHPSLKNKQLLKLFNKLMKKLEESNI